MHIFVIKHQHLFLAEISW